MAQFDLLPDDAFSNLPEQAEEAFLLLLALVEENYTSYSQMEDVDRQLLRKEFGDQINAIAGELGVEGVIPPPNIEYDGAFAEFRSKLQAAKTRLKLRLRTTRDPATVAIKAVTKSKIEEEIERLRDLIDRSDLSDKKKEALYAKLDELIDELHRRKLSLAKFVIIAGGIATILGGSSAALSNASEARDTVMNILAWVSEEKAAEDQQPLRLAPPPKALPSPSYASPDDTNEKET